MGIVLCMRQKTENSYLTNGPAGNNSARFLGLEVNGSTDSSALANFVR